MASFRVAVEVAVAGASPKTFYILVDRSQFSTIRDVENHIRRTLRIPSPFLLSIGHVFLPCDESVKIIVPGDVLKVNFRESFDPFFRQQVDFSELGDAPLPPRPKKKKRALASASTGLGGVLNLLRQEAVGQKVEAVGQEVEALPTTANESMGDISEGGDQNPSEDNDSSLGKKDRKRKRKHRRSKVQEEPQVTPPTKDTLHYSKEQRTPSGNHIFFDDGPKKSQESTPEVPNSETRTPPVLNGKHDDWKERLLANASVSQNQKTYFRNKESTSNDELDLEGLDPTKYPVLTEPKEDQVVAFKVLKMDQDYTPQMSGLIVATVECINGTDVSFKILKGEEEFAEPTGKFSFEEEGCQRRTKDLVSLRMDELIQPRLIKP